ncbi:unnamed protein product [Amoebophrya sp. A25]|nr:unnamed protein product [Amoebophrya sp. A25]|eukprot:GSA25T00009878001.1
MVEVRYLFLALGTHLSWGLYHPVVRYLETVTGMHIVYILGSAHLLSGTVNALCMLCCGANEETNPAEKPKDTKTASTNTIASGESESTSGFTAKKCWYGVSYGLLSLARALTNMASAAVIIAFYVQSVSLLNPYVVALLSFCLLGERKLPRGFMLSCALCVCGSFLVIAGENIVKGRTSSGLLRRMSEDSTTENELRTQIGAEVPAREDVGAEVREAARSSSSSGTLRIASLTRVQMSSTKKIQKNDFPTRAEDPADVAEHQHLEERQTLPLRRRALPPSDHARPTGRVLTAEPDENALFAMWKREYQKRNKIQNSGHQAALLNSGAAGEGKNSRDFELFEQWKKEHRSSISSNGVLGARTNEKGKETLKPQNKNIDMLSTTPAGRPSKPAQLDPNDPQNILIGVSLQVISILLSGLMRIGMKATARVGITKRELQAYQNVSNFVPLLCASWILEGWQKTDRELLNDAETRRLTASKNGIPIVTHFVKAIGGGSLRGWLVFQDLSLYEIGLFLVFALVVFYWANMGQIEAVRGLGPTLYSSFQPLRMLSSIVGSYLIMKEEVEVWLSWLGIAILCITLSCYFGLQVKSSTNSGSSASSSTTSSADERNVLGTVTDASKENLENGGLEAGVEMTYDQQSGGSTLKTKKIRTTRSILGGLGSRKSSDTSRAAFHALVVDESTTLGVGVMNYQKKADAAVVGRTASGRGHTATSPAE